jgi:parallel beta-helix repeat protein
MVGIEVADGANNVTISNNTVSNSRFRGIFFGGAFAVSSGAVISGNILLQCGTQPDQGILVSGVSVDIRSSSVEISSNVVDGAGVDGIRIKWVTDANVTGNTVHGCGGYGLAFEDSNTDCILIANNDLRWNILGSLNLNNTSTIVASTNNPSIVNGLKNRFLVS